MEPYRADEDAWDWKLLFFLTGIARAHPETLLIVLLFIMFAGWLLLWGWIAQQIGLYLWHVYKEYARRDTTTALILKISFPVVVLGHRDLSLQHITRN
jgi:cytochrome bd-type quinol oxidase subunit 1